MKAAVFLLWLLEPKFWHLQQDGCKPPLVEGCKEEPGRGTLLPQRTQAQGSQEQQLNTYYLSNLSSTSILLPLTETHDFSSIKL